MKRADEPLVRCHMMASTRDEAYAIIGRTGERLWELYSRLIHAEHERLFQPSEEPASNE